MSISDNYVPIKTLGNGSTVDFGGSWAVIASSYLRVYLENVSTGAQVLQTFGVDYTLVFDSSGFTVTFIVAPPATEYVVIGRDVAIDQTDPYRTSKGFQGAVLENSLDKLTAINQDQTDQIGRSLKFPLGSALVGVLPIPTDDFYLGWSGAGGTIKNSVKTITQVEAAVDLVEAVTAGSGVLVSSADTTIGFLNTKLVAGSGLSFTVNNPGSVETFNIDVDDASTSQKGIVEKATSGEMTSGDADKFPDAAEVKSYVDTEISNNSLLFQAEVLHVQDQKAATTDGGTFTSGADRTRDINTEVTNTLTGGGLVYSLPYDSKSGTFSAGETVTGGTSGATAVIADTNSGSTPLKVYGVTGTFQDNEEITGGTSAATADVDNLSPDDSGTGLDYANQVVLPAGTYAVKASAPAYKVGRHKAKLYNVTDTADEFIGTSEAADTTAAMTNSSFVSGRIILAAQKILELRHRCQSTKSTDGFGLNSNFAGIIEVYSDLEITKVA